MKKSHPAQQETSQGIADQLPRTLALYRGGGTRLSVIKASGLENENIVVTSFTYIYNVSTFTRKIDTHRCPESLCFKIH